MFTEPIKLPLPEADITYYPGFLNTLQGDYFMRVLLEKTPWQQDDITVFGKTYPQPRLTALYGINKKPYSYSNITMHPLLFTKDLSEIKHLIEKLTNTKFTSCLLNLYRDGKDSNGWHADNEPELGKNPVIASLSLGEERWFHLKHRSNKELKTKLLLQHGSLLIMKGETQHNWLHQIAKTKKQLTPRINLTFRIIK